MAPRLFIGLDLGGSGTRAALADTTGRVLASGRGPTGLRGGSGAAARRQLSRALAHALAPIAPLVAGEACVAFAGTRGLSITGRRDSLLLELKLRLPTAEVHVSNDALIALWGGLAGREGVAVVAGAGSIALARGADGREGRAGGWGYLLGDEGSGYWIGREALRVLLATLEGRRPSGALSTALARTIGRDRLTDTLAWLYAGQDQVERLAAFAPLVARAALEGDSAAHEILTGAGSALAEAAAAAARQVWPQAAPEGLRVARCGGVWSAGGALLEAFESTLRHALPSAVPMPPQLPPIGGAVLLAMGADREPLGEAVLEQLVQALRPL